MHLKAVDLWRWRLCAMRPGRDSAARLLAWVCLVVLVGGRPAAAQEIDASQAESPRDVLEFDQKLGAQLPFDARFVDDHGDEVLLGDYFGEKPVVFALIYYKCPMLCGLVINATIDALKQVELEAGEDYQVVLISIDPRESPDLAGRAKAKAMELLGRPTEADGWHFLTGHRADSRAVADAVGFGFVFDDESGEYAHPAGIMIATPEGLVSHYFYGVAYLPRDVRLGLVEASDGKIGSPVDKFLLRCFRYDPQSGTYQGSVIMALKVGGMLVVLGMAGFIGTSIWRERRHSSVADAAGGADVDESSPPAR